MLSSSARILLAAISGTQVYTMLLSTDEAEEGNDGWDMVQRPGGWSVQADAPAEGPGVSIFMLPPPPSEPELVSELLSQHLAGSMVLDCQENSPAWL